ncbi:MAG TPA: beta-ketoacyl-[acyl-carrier-protein] synthase family protein [Spirochaetota bacterium]|nr:beta-ketoacyl-[acyl-carrier-protein] synthase family protein [Spirochaetota bacterium]HPL19085.1 beta-ketoacyl-[acyl-carrier-protein] synthase family protein [Spirochaetota bacterium]HQF07643.1 beta-ketoacyl-[acyl-carrier-protein] synthase family protein [Spirochaetota bacterium]HQJ69548.1 beta-ketoacyl-[acyl-carrier-protein] synthase family protein [Spirochaetota bacterium]HRS75648.1 beta-ketoacyl-[acyl-carrier-protein] synthase family protein [Spirochaetota bacterium]
MGRKVVITGMNIISSLGLNLEENWNNLAAGKSGVAPISLFDASNCETKIAAQVPAGFEAYASTFCKKRTAHQMTRVTAMAFVCASEAIELSGIDFNAVDRRRTAVIMGVVSTGNSSVEKGAASRNRIIKSMSNAIPAWISLHYGIEGPSYSVNTACASSAYAMGLGYDMIRSGSADIVVTGGADSTINPEEINSFNEMYALSTRNDAPRKASRPFSRDRDGFVIGEGAGIMILESEESASKRNAPVIAEFAGYAVTSEAYNIMAPKKDGEGMYETMKLALANTGVDPSEVDYINAHGTSTMLNDLYETMAIKRLFGDRAYAIPVTSSKSMMGHTIAAAGAIEAAITALSIRYQMVTPTINYDDPDPDLDLDYVPNNSRAHKINVAISNSFAFGGHNATIVLKKY